MGEDRWLEWDGCVNVRDLGGLPTTDGGATRWGAVVRADSTHQLTATGWAAAWDHGIRTVVDLRHPREVDEHRPDCDRPTGFTVVHRPIEDEADLAFVERWGTELATPRYYADALDRFADRVGAAVIAVARAPEGGVVCQCVAGRDRTGLITAVLLDLVGIPAEAIAADHALSYEPMPGLHGTGEGFLAPGWEAEHAAVIGDLLDGWDVEAYLRGAGVTAADLAAIRARMLAS